MEDYAAVRQMYLHEHKSQRQIAKDLGISRNTVTKYCEGGTYHGLRASCLQEDAMEPNQKQYHITTVWYKSVASPGRKVRYVNMNGESYRLKST